MRDGTPAGHQANPIFERDNTERPFGQSDSIPFALAP